MSQTDKFESRPEATTQTRWIFLLLGVQPMTKNSTITEKRISAVMYLICRSLLAFIIIPANIQLFWFERLEIKLAYFGPLGTAMACALKYFAIISRRDDITNCIQQIEEDWCQSKNKDSLEIMKQHTRQGRRITTFCGSVMYTGGILHQIMMPFLPGSVVSIFSNSTKRLLVYPMSEIILDDQVTPTYEILYIIHIVAGIVVCTIALASCHLAILFVTHTSSLTEIMTLKLENLMTAQGEVKQNLCMSEVIDINHKIIKFSHTVEICLREICLISILEALYVICLAEYYALLTWNHNETFGAIIYLILLQGFVGSFFIFCHVGEIMKEQVCSLFIHCQ
uniref:Olfactory receptor 7 n=1 Tax=Meteorus pulchricornis TaxID=51522 RepID=A0A1S5VFJ7_9HYME|nr:olfactory receptor 7 [Meteorus pulchricornis]